MLLCKTLTGASNRFFILAIVAWLLSGCSGVSNNSSNGNSSSATSPPDVTSSSTSPNTGHSSTSFSSINLSSTSPSNTSTSSTSSEITISSDNTSTNESSISTSSTAAAESCGFNQVQTIFTQRSCLVCHGAQTYLNIGGNLNLESGNVGQRLLDRTTEFGGSDCATEKLIDSSNVENSLLLKLVDPDRYDAFQQGACKRASMPQSGPVMNTEEVACITEWASQVIATETPTVTESKPFAPTGAPEALSKAKYILHGGAPTFNELEDVGGTGSYNASALQQLIKQWQTTEAYSIKMREFMRFALQLDVSPTARYADQFNSIRSSAVLDRNALGSNLREQFTLTALDIAKSGEDFRNIVTTRRWKVTTAVLVALTYADKPNQTEDRNELRGSAPEDYLSQFAHLIEPDYNDWRYVTFTQSQTPAQYENSSAFANQLRSIPDGGSLALRFPRVGFFSSPAFFEMWATNIDNLFRVTASQTLIAALDASFNPSDATPHLSEDGIDQDHSDPTTTCYQCHRHMDTMKLIFDNYQSIRHRSTDVQTTQQATFSFLGVSGIMESVDDFASLIANHPRFATAWVQKLCMWANSQRCEEADEEFIRLANDFASNQFNMSLLVQAFFSSPLFTATELTTTHEETEYQISMARSNHFCRAMEQRALALNAQYNTTGTLRLCNKFYDFGIIPSDQLSRGSEDYVVPTQLTGFYSKSIESRCAGARTQVFASNSNKLINTSGLNPEQLADALVQSLMGIPSNHPRYETALNEMNNIYALATHETACTSEDAIQTQDTISCGYDQPAFIAWRWMWFTACSSPDAISVGF